MGRTAVKAKSTVNGNDGTVKRNTTTVEDDPPAKRLRVRQKKPVEQDNEPQPSTKGKRGKKKPDIEVKSSSKEKRETTTRELKKIEIEDKETAVSTEDKKLKKNNKKTKEEKAKVTIKEEEETTNADTTSAPSKSNRKKSSKKADAPVRTAVERSVVKKGGVAPVDGLCTISSSSHVYFEDDDSGKVVWDCMLNQTNIQFNNNKFYIIQLLKDDNKNAFSVWMRWGRVGANGQNSLKPCGGNLNSAKSIFEKKFRDKTHNDWCLKDMFEKVQGKYDILEMDYSDGQDEVDNLQKVKQEQDPHKEVASKLEEKVRLLISLICDVKAMEEAVIEMKYDAKKAPLGKLTKEQVKAGYAALKDIEAAVNESKSSNAQLVQACNAFYTRIPHYFGMKVPPLIRTPVEIKEKIQLLEALGDIQVAMNIINQPKDANLHPVDQHYAGLQCDIHSLDKEGEHYKVLEKYLRTTHGKTHTMYSMELLDIFAVSKSAEVGRFKDVGNRMLLWHGSRLTNWAGILNQGLRIAPPEAPSTGYMFGKGVYFADMASKSANYCMPSSRNNVGLLVLCDVALGTSNELLNAKYDGHKLPAGCHSVKGCGTTAPTSHNFVKLDDCTVPMGPGVDEKKKGYALQYNEYIVYDVAQVRIKYLFQVNFKF